MDLGDGCWSLTVCDKICCRQIQDARDVFGYFIKILYLQTLAEGQRALNQTASK